MVSDGRLQFGVSISALGIEIGNEISLVENIDLVEKEMRPRMPESQQDWKTHTPDTFADLSSERRASTHLRYITLSAIAAAMIVLVLTALLTYQQMLRLFDSRQQVIQTYEVIDNIDSIKDALEDAETDERAYVNTGQKSALIPFEREIVRVPLLITDVKRLTSTNESEQRLLSELKPEIEYRVQQLKKTIELRSHHRFTLPLRVLPSDSASSSSLQMQKVLRGMRDHEEGVLAERSSILYKNANEAVVRLVSLASLATILLLLTAFSLERFMNSSWQSQKALLVQYIATKILAESDSEPQAIAAILSLICGTLSVAAAAIWRVGKHDNHILRCDQFYCSPNSPTPALEAISRSSTFSPGVGLAGRVWQKGEAAWVIDVLSAPNMPRAAYAAKDGVHTAFAVPIMVGGRAVGVLEIFDRHSTKANTKTLRAFSSLGVQLGLFLNRIEKEQELADRELQLTEFFDNAVVAIHWIAPDGTILRANRAAHIMLGYEVDEMIGHNISEVHIDRQKFGETLRMMAQHEERRNFECKLRCKDGSIKDCIVDSNMYFEDGQLKYSRCFARDITQLKKAESELREKESRTRALLETAPDGIITFDSDGIIESANQSIASLLACKPEDLIGRSLSTFIPNFFTADGASTSEDNIVTGQSRIFGTGRELTALKSNCDAIPIELAWSVLNLGDRTLFTAIVRDISARKAAENRLTLQYLIAKVLTETSSIEAATSLSLEIIGELMNWSIGTIWLIDDSERVLRCADTWCAAGLDRDALIAETQKVSFARGAGLLGRAWETEDSCWVEDITKNKNLLANFYPAEPGLRTAFAFPLSAGGEVIGVCDFMSDKIRSLDEQVLQTLSTVGHQIGQFIVRMRAEEKLHRSEVSLKISQERYDLAVEGAQDGIWDWDLRTGINYYSPRCYQQLGYQPSELDISSKEKLFKLIHHDDIERIGLAAQAHLDRKSPFDVEYRAKTKNGDYKWIHSRGQAFWDAEGRAVRFAGSHRDITERILAQELLRQSESRFRQMAENINEIFWITDARGAKPMFVSPAYERIFGRTIDQLFAEPHQFFDATHPDDRNKLAEVIRHQREVNYSCKIEYRICRPDGEVRWLWARLCSIVDERGEVSGLCGVTADITERKEAEKRVSEFYSTVSHELRTPLTSIRGSLGLIEGGVVGEVSPRVAKLINIGRVESDRLIRIINDILDIKKIESGSFELNKVLTNPFDIVSKSLEGIYGMSLEAKVSLRSSMLSKRHFQGDVDKLIQVLTNLVSNAIKYSPHDGTVTVTTTDIGADKIRFAVCDQGPGIKKEDLVKLFGMFQQLDQSDSRPKGGTGLGLAISKAIVESHGGTIGVETESGHGCRFWFELPTVLTASFVPDDDSPEIGMPLLGHLRHVKRVLLVEDDLATMEIIKQQLSVLPMQIFEANDGTDAIRIAQKEEPDLIILDLGLPNKDGFDVVTALRQHRANKAALLIYTARDLENKEKSALTLGHTAHLIKSRTSEQEFLSTVQELLNGLAKPKDDSQRSVRANVD